MENGTSIGELLRRERESRSLSLEQVHESTKITSQNLSALEDDRFDAFPNKVYARAFLRDYANFLGLDSATLLTSYEEKWGAPVVVEPVVVPKTRRSWRWVGWTFLVIVLLGGVAAAGYIYWPEFSQLGARKPTIETRSHKPDKPGTLPAPPVVKPVDETEATVPEPKPAPEPPPAAPEKLSLEVAAFVPVWVRIIADGQTVFIGTMAKGDKKVFEGNDNVEIRAGKAGGVQLKLNGVLQEPLGALGESKTRKYTRADLPAPPTTTVPNGPATVTPPATGQNSPAPGR